MRRLPNLRNNFQRMRLNGGVQMSLTSGASCITRKKRGGPTTSVAKSTAPFTRWSSIIRPVEWNEKKKRKRKRVRSKDRTIQFIFGQRTTSGHVKNWIVVVEVATTQRTENLRIETMASPRNIHGVTVLTNFYLCALGNNGQSRGACSLIIHRSSIRR